jgi:hypothetical protein
MAALLRNNRAYFKLGGYLGGSSKLLLSLKATTGTAVYRFALTAIFLYGERVFACLHLLHFTPFACEWASPPIWSVMCVGS